MRTLACLLLPVVMFCSCSNSIRPEPVEAPLWAAQLSGEVNRLGVQNWIVVAEASYPVLSKRGVRTVAVDGEIPEVVDFVIKQLATSESLVPSFNTASELNFVKNDRAPGVDHYRRELKRVLGRREVKELGERNLRVLASSDAAKFAVLVVKTRTSLPYSSVYIELDSGYWNRAMENDLRSAEKKNRLEQERVELKRQETERRRMEAEMRKKLEAEIKMRQEVDRKRLEAQKVRKLVMVEKHKADLEKEGNETID